MPQSADQSGDQKYLSTVLVFRNTALVGIAEVLSMPISVLFNALLGRFLGPTNLGYMFLATTICAAATPFVNFGHVGPLRQPSRQIAAAPAGFSVRAWSGAPRLP